MGLVKTRRLAAMQKMQRAKFATPPKVKTGVAAQMRGHDVAAEDQIAAFEKLGFSCVSGNKQWKLDYANICVPILKTPSDCRTAMSTAMYIVNQCF